MTENEFLLNDRLQKIKSTIDKYGEDNFYLSFSGGKDSTVLSALLDMACPDNKIPRVYADTGIELNMIRDFVYKKSETDKRIVIIKPSKPIKQTLKEYGYPFKSKKHSALLETYQKYKTTEGRIGIQHYLDISNDGVEWGNAFLCPDVLRYQFKPDFKIKISDRCCDELKENPVRKWMKENNKSIGIVGIMRTEGGRRINAKCLSFVGKKLKNFQPMVILSKEWEEWFIKQYNIEICEIYKPPYNFVRTGCKGCPFAKDLQKELDILQKYFPNERKQCEIIWQPIYEEYRRIGYRLKG